MLADRKRAWVSVFFQSCSCVSSLSALLPIFQPNIYVRAFHVADYGMCSDRWHSREDRIWKDILNTSVSIRESPAWSFKGGTLCHIMLLSTVTILIALLWLLFALWWGVLEEDCLFSTSSRQAPLCLIVSVNLCCRSSSIIYFFHILGAILWRTETDKIKINKYK